MTEETRYFKKSIAFLLYKLLPKKIESHDTPVSYTHLDVYKRQVQIVCVI